MNLPPRSPGDNHRHGRACVRYLFLDSRALRRYMGGIPNHCAGSAGLARRRTIPSEHMPIYNFSPEFLARLRQRYEEDTDESVASIAADFEIGERLVYRLARREKWRMRSDPRPLPRHIRLHDKVRAEAATPIMAPAPECSSARPRESGDPTLWIPACAGMSGEPLRGNERSEDAPESLQTLDRLERLVLNEIAREEAERAALGPAPRAPAEAVHKARAYSTLLQTLQAIERARLGQGTQPVNSDESSDPIPHDIDDFRHELARRIDAFVASRTDARDAERSGEPTMVEEAR